MSWFLITLITLWLLKKALEKVQAYYLGVESEKQREKQAAEDAALAVKWQEESVLTAQEKQSIQDARAKYDEFLKQDYEAQVRAEIESMTRGG